ncbi:MAG: hypothetical protein HY300_18200 [Verrucomicrobia bacterium]|nr:hypothetical protein [Verrucomicrobiota bacterium]
MLQLHALPSGYEHGFNAAVLVLAAVTTLTGLARFIPLQNVASIAVLTLIAAAGMEWLAVKTGFAPVQLNAVASQSWPVPLAWLVFTLNSRGVAKLIAANWSGAHSFGIVVLVFAATLTAALFHGFAEAPPQPRTAIQSVVLLILAAPWLINKRPAPLPPDTHQLWVWLLMDLLLTAGNARHHLWPATTMGIASGALVLVLAQLGQCAWWRNEKAFASGKFD